MDVALLEQEINTLRSRLYELGREVNEFSDGEILKISQKLDKKIILYQKALLIGLLELNSKNDD